MLPTKLSSRKTSSSMDNSDKLFVQHCVVTNSHVGGLMVDALVHQVNEGVIHFGHQSKVHILELISPSPCNCLGWPQGSASCPFASCRSKTPNQNDTKQSHVIPVQTMPLVPHLLWLRPVLLVPEQFELLYCSVCVANLDLLPIFIVLLPPFPATPIIALPSRLWRAEQSPCFVGGMIGAPQSTSGRSIHMGCCGL